MEEPQKKIEGWRRMGIGMGAITALSLNPTIDFKIAVIIGTIAIIGIVSYSVLGYGRRPKKTD